MIRFTLLEVPGRDGHRFVAVEGHLARDARSPVPRGEGIFRPLDSIGPDELPPQLIVFAIAAARDVLASFPELAPEAAGRPVARIPLYIRDEGGAEPGLRVRMSGPPQFVAGDPNPPA